jgi:phosphatidylserine/phosphatidylglycerophosphate/cardiolipin synthase-like enzyme
MRESIDRPLAAPRLSRPGCNRRWFSFHGWPSRAVERWVMIRSVPHLHAKSYLIDLRCGLVGSANLTASGLGLATKANAELSISLTPPQVAAARSQLALWWDISAAVDEPAIAFAEETASALPPAAPAHIDPTLPDALTLQTEQLLAEARDQARELWMKAQWGAAHPDQWRQP